MRIIICLLFSSFILSYTSLHAQQQDVPDTTSFAQLIFEESGFNFGEVNQGEKVSHDFKFKNGGNIPLILLNVLSTCGCTAPEWPKEPMAPGQEGVIKIVFDSQAKIGRQNKVVTIRSNAKSGDLRLRISAMVLPKEE